MLGEQSLLHSAEGSVLSVCLQTHNDGLQDCGGRSRDHWQVQGHAHHHMSQHPPPLLQAPCQHNFCLACFKRWVAQGKKSCPTCRHSFPAKFASNPRINTALTVAIRMAKQGVRKPTAAQQERIRDKDRPDEAFTTDRCMPTLLPALCGLRAGGADSPHNLMGL